MHRQLPQGLFLRLKKVTIWGPGGKISVHQELLYVTAEVFHVYPWWTVELQPSQRRVSPQQCMSDICESLCVWELRLEVKRFLTQIASILFWVLFFFFFKRPYRNVGHALAGEVAHTAVVLGVLVPRASEQAAAVLFTALHARARPSWATVCGEKHTMETHCH